jgi:hypothetical protein
VGGSCEHGNELQAAKKTHFTLVELILFSQRVLGTIWFINNLYAFILIIWLEIWTVFDFNFLVCLVEY